MSHHKPIVRVDAYTRVILTVLAVLLTLAVAGQWAQAPDAAPQARAAEKDGFAKAFNTNAQRQALLEAQQQTNEKLDEVISLLRSGKIEVRLADAPEAKGGDDGSAAGTK